ncbi:MAG: hypothetical protein ACXVW2_18030 [Nocardioidaceae bacterium]
MGKRSPEPPPVAARRGRRPQGLDDDTPLDERFGGVAARLAWVLRTTRLAYDGGRFAKAADFAQHLRELGLRADATRVSRWESAEFATAAAGAAYETGFGMRPGSLTALLDGISRSLGDTTPPAPPRRDVSTADVLRIESALEAVLATGRTGLDWLDLAQAVRGRDQVFLPRSTWRQLADTLVGELSRSVGLAYVTRFEALCTLVGHPRAQGHVVDATMAYVADPACQVAIDAILVLEHVRSARVTDAVIELLGSGQSSLVRGATWTAVVKLARGQVDDAQLAALVDALAAAVAAEPTPAVLADLAWVLTRVPSRPRALMRRTFRDQGLDLPAVQRQSSLARLPGPQRSIVERLVADAEAGARIPASGGMLERLVLEALFHPFRERKHQAGLILMVSPYAAVLARSCTEVADAADDAGLVTELTRLLTYLATDAEVDRLYGWVAGERGGAHARGALLSLAHVPHEPRADLLLATIEHGAAELRGPALYAAGMLGLPELATLQDPTRFPPRTVAAAAWWQREGRAIRDVPHPN